MDDLVSRKHILLQLSHNLRKGDDEWELAVRNDMETVRKAPSIERPTVIHCKDCVYYGRADKRRFYRGYDCLDRRIASIVPDRDFCSRAVRRKENDE